MMHKLETSQQGGDDALIERMQLDLAYKRVKAYATGLAIAVLLVAALWSEVAHEILLIWLVAVSLIISVRYVYAQRYMRMEHSTSIKLEKWKAVFLVGAAVSGAGSAIVVFCFFSFQLDPVTLLLVLNAVGLAGFAALSLARVSSVAVAFQVAALLPLSIWLFSTGEHIHYLMGLNVLLYLGLMLFLSRTTHQVKLSSFSTTKQSGTLSQRQEVKQRMPRFSESAHGFFYSATHHPDEHTSMPFVSITTRVSASGIDDELGLRSEDVPDGIEPILAFIHPDDIDRYVEARDASQLTLSPLCLELRINHPIKGERWVELKSLPQREPDGATTWHGFMCDITDFKRSEALLFERCEHDQHLSNIVENLPGFVYTFRQSPDGVFSFPYVSVGIRKLFGLEPEELLHGIAPVMAMIHADDHSCIIDSIATSACEMSVLNCTYRMTFPALGERWMSARSMPQRAADGGILWHGVMLDVTEQKQMEAALVAREQESRTLIENSPDVIARYDRNCRHLFANPTFGAEVEGGVAALIGKTPTEFPGGEYAEFIETNIKQVFLTGENAEFDIFLKNKAGEDVYEHVRMIAERNLSGEVVTVLMVGRDITELHVSRHKLNQMVFYDALTSLPNRALFNDRLQKMLKDSSGHGHQAGLLLLNLDGFKAVNDAMGHHVGDALLCEAAKRLSACVRPYDTVARLGGDEFAILLPEIRSGEDLGSIARKVLEVFRSPFRLEGRDLFVSTSVGGAVYPDDRDDASDLIRHADSAMYYAKSCGRNNFQSYSPELTLYPANRLVLDAQLRQAECNGEFELYYQPQIDLSTGILIGTEALLRWNSAELGLMMPDNFIGIAEDTGLIVSIGEWVLRTACHAARKWNEGKTDGIVKVAVNLSARQFQMNDLVKTIRNVLRETGCRPEWIECEITESLLLDNSERIYDMLSEINALGISLSLDDFGTGYSSLGYLKRYPMKSIKIDSSFVRDIMTDLNSAELVKAIVSMARSLHLELVAEGVESEDQAAFLKANGCHVGQGWLYGKAMPQAQFEVMLLARKSAVSS